MLPTQQLLLRSNSSAAGGFLPLLHFPLSLFTPKLPTAAAMDPAAIELPATAAAAMVTNGMALRRRRGGGV
jgi:hypothetical protein